MPQIEWAQVSAGIAIGALVMQYFSHRRNVRRDRVEDQRRAGEDLQARAAKVTGRMLREPYGRLELTNEGPAEAFDVFVKVDGQPLQERQHFRDLPLPVPVLASGQTVEALMLVYNGMQSQHIVETTWTDGSGQPGRWVSQVTVQ